MWFVFIGFDQTLKKELTKAAAAEWCCNQREELFRLYRDSYGNTSA